VAADEMPHPGAGCDEWIFAAWTPDGSFGMVSGHRIIGGSAWYWFGLVQSGYPLLAITEWDVRLRSNPFIVKAPQMWAEHHCVAPLEQWTIGNEAHAVALDDPDEALGRSYGVPTPITTDIEWYANGPVRELPPIHLLSTDSSAEKRGDAAARSIRGSIPAGFDLAGFGPAGFGPAGFVQDGVAHGVVELLDRPYVELAEVPARRWRRWTPAGHTVLAPLRLEPVIAHTGLRSPVAFPDDFTCDWVLTNDGWRERSVRSVTDQRRLPSEPGRS
jgi:hypothetical protein